MVEGISSSVRGPPGVPECRSPAPVWDAVGAVAMAAAAAALVTAVPALAALVSGLLAAVGCAWVPAAVAAATAAGLLSAAAFTLLVPELGDDALMQAEAAILADTKSDWRHEWSEFEEDGLAWQVHSVRAEADAALPDDASAVHIVVVHGHSSGSALFQCVVDDVITGLGAPGVLHKGQRAVVHLLDMPGWGRSPAPPAFAALREQHAIVSASASMLRGWLRLRGLHGQGRVVLLGHSVGGLIALRYALRHPSDLRQLILADPAGLVPSAAHTVGWTLLMRFMPPQLVARTFGRIVFAPFMAFYGSTMEEDHRFPAYYYTLAYCTTTRGRADVIWASCVAHDWSLTRVRWRSPAVAELLEAEVPLSLVWGSSDQLFPATHAAMVHSLRPDADVYVIDEAGHNPAHNDSAATAAAIVDAVAAFNGERPHLGDVASDGGVDGAPGVKAAAPLRPSLLLPAPPLAAGTGATPVRSPRAGASGAVDPFVAAQEASSRPAAASSPTALRGAASDEPPRSSANAAAAAPCPGSRPACLAARCAPSLPPAAKPLGGVVVPSPTGARVRISELPASLAAAHAPQWGNPRPSEAKVMDLDAVGRARALSAALSGEQQQQRRRQTVAPHDAPEEGVPEPSSALEEPSPRISLRAAAGAVTAAARFAKASPSLRHRMQARGAWVKAMRAAGSGRCVGCRHRVRVEGHSWYCNCGKWTFESHSNREEHHRNQQALARFLTELHGTSDFDASKAGYLNLRPLSDPDSSAPRKLSEVSVGSVSDCDTSPVRAPVQGHVFLLSSSSPSP